MVDYQAERVRHHAEFRRCLVDLDVPAMTKLVQVIFPPHERPTSELEVLVTMHAARTDASSIPDRLRVYSHYWLKERGLPSALPDHLRAKAEQMKPEFSDGVGVSVKFTSPELAGAAGIIQGAMNDAILEAYAEGKKDPVHVRQRMDEARKKTSKKLFGRWA